jgi:hypothetical protein
MSHRSFQQLFGTPFHVSWNGEDVSIGDEDAEPVSAVVDLDLPISDVDRGEGVTGKGKLIFREAVVIEYGDPIWIRGDRWEYDRERKPEDGNKIIFVIRREQQVTISPMVGYRGGR